MPKSPDTFGIALAIADRASQQSGVADVAADRLLDALPLSVLLYDEQRRAAWDEANEGDRFDGLS